jgi:hypothetical protein
MRVAAVVVAASIVVIGGALPVRADIYVWRDSAGVSHYTNDIANVPPEYRGSAMTVAKDWVRAEPPPESAPAPPNPAPASAPAAAPAASDGGAARDGYEAGYVAGLRASQPPAPAAVAASQLGPVVQVTEEPARDHLVSVFAPVVAKHRQGTPNDKENDRRKQFPLARHAPFLRGPAGPPPVSFTEE